MKSIIHIGLAVLLILGTTISCKNSEDNSSQEPAEESFNDGPFYDGEAEELVSDYMPIGYSFEYEVNCDTLEREELEVMSEENKVLGLDISVSDSIRVNYAMASDAYNFFEGYYEQKEDTLSIWTTTGSWEDLDSYCIYSFAYTLPKLDLDTVFIKVVDEVRVVDLK